jgi:hypothetical protein
VPFVLSLNFDTPEHLSAHAFSMCSDMKTSTNIKSLVTEKVYTVLDYTTFVNLLHSLSLVYTSASEFRTHANLLSNWKLLPHLTFSLLWMELFNHAEVHTVHYKQNSLIRVQHAETLHSTFTVSIVMLTGLIITDSIHALTTELVCTTYCTYETAYYLPTYITTILTRI